MHCQGQRGFIERLLCQVPSQQLDAASLSLSLSRLHFFFCTWLRFALRFGTFCVHVSSLSLVKTPASSFVPYSFLASPTVFPHSRSISAEYLRAHAATRKTVGELSFRVSQGASISSSLIIHCVFGHAQKSK